MVASVAHIQENPMKALILRADPKTACDTARALIDKGFQTLSVDTQAVAHALIRVDAIDLLVMDERIEGQLTHAIALSGERKNPYLSAILMTDRGREDTDDLFDLIPSLYGLMSSDTTPEMLAKLAMSAVENVDTAVARVAQTAQDEAQEEVLETDVAPLILAHTDAASSEDDSESGAPCYADVAIAAPALAEIVAAENQIRLERTYQFDMTPRIAPVIQLEKVADAIDMDHVALEKNALLEKVEDVINEEVASLFRKYPSSAYVPLHTHARAIAG